MTRELTNPLQGILKQAGQSLPATTGATAKYKARWNADGPILLIADHSGSMQSPAWGGQRKIDLLRMAVDQVMSEASCRLLVFSALVQESRTVPEPASSTALHLALTHAAALRPRHSLVISDGQPDSEELALAAAETMTGVIDVLYIGPDGDKAAMDFMRRLARVGSGRYTAQDISRPAGPPALERTMRQLLPGPR